MKLDRKTIDLHVYLNKNDFNTLNAEAVVRKMSLSATTRICLSEYFSLKREMASSIECKGELGDKHNDRIIHSLLARTETRMAKTLEAHAKQQAHMQMQVDYLTALIDRMYLGLITHLPEVPENLKTEALASGNKRHEKWLHATEALIESRD